ncbi:MAG: U32 family peptidase [Eubacteriales bacterium]|nr:U32 family peptidase [Eubacteriales bacterium]
MQKIELLAPAGSLEKLKVAILYGADAVYMGGTEFGLRAFADNFTHEEMIQGVEFAHKKGKKVYLTINIIPHNSDIKNLPDYLKRINGINFDALIISDPGVYMLIREQLPDMELHLSTQANNTNWVSAAFWHEHGFKRVILARELSMQEIKEMHDKTPEGLDLEVFVHGSMCISHSGRCLLSNYLTGRDSNRGQCTHPCRWKYYLVEETRPGKYMPIMEDENGAYIMNSKDLCMIKHIPELINSGVRSFKIEGRIKSAFYVASVVKAYRHAIDSYYENPDLYSLDPYWIEELKKAGNREYTTGFFFGKPGKEEQTYDSASNISEYDFVGIVRSFDKTTGYAEIEQKNRMQRGDEVEILTPKGRHFSYTIDKMLDADRIPIVSAPHGKMTVYMPFEHELEEYTMLRMKKLCGGT